MRKYIFAALLLLLSPAMASAAQLAACTTGQTTCTNDTTNDQGLVNATLDTQVGVRVFNLWNRQCASVFAEAVTTTGHMFRVNMCLAIAAGRIPYPQLVSMILSAQVQTQILCGVSGTGAGGCMVDADVNFAIAAALAVTETVATTTATGAQGANALTVASATNIVTGMSVNAVGVPPGTTVSNVVGTTVYLSTVTTAALSSTAITFVLDTGLVTRGW